ncbi:hypothetical protein Tco_0863679 [Tanacetum coccineum]
MGEGLLKSSGRGGRHSENAETSASLNVMNMRNELTELNADFPRMRAMVGTPKTDSNKEFPSLDYLLGNTPPLKMAALKSTSSLKFAKLLSTGSITKKVNFCALKVPSCEGADATIRMSSLLEVNERLGNTVYGYLLGNQFSSTRALEEMLENGPWMIRNIPIIPKKWAPNSDVYKGELTTVLSCGRSGYARAIIELRADFELKEYMVVAIPRMDGKGNILHTIRAEYEWKPQGLLHARSLDTDEWCPKNNIPDVLKMHLG